jgi:transketolase
MSNYQLNPKIFDPDIEKISMRDGYGEGLLEAGKKNQNVVALTADLKQSTRVDPFAEKFPDRFFECGVAEQNMIGIAAGLALNGKIPFASSFAVFTPGRTWDQIRVSVCYSKANVKIIGSHAGITVGGDGATHEALEDIAISRVIPNLAVVIPCDYIEARKATVYAAEHKGPLYLRLARGKTAVITTENTPFKFGQAEVFKEGKDATIIACGPLVYYALLVAKELEKEGLDIQVINNHTIKPIDKLSIAKAAKETGAIVTVEEHQVAGGLGGAVAEVLAESYPAPIERIGVKDSFGESGKPSELLEKYGMSVKDIKEAVKAVLKRKQK